jgi:hypothetical protein
MLLIIAFIARSEAKRSIQYVRIVNKIGIFFRNLSKMLLVIWIDLYTPSRMATLRTTMIKNLHINYRVLHHNACCCVGGSTRGHDRVWVLAHEKGPWGFYLPARWIAIICSKTCRRPNWTGAVIKTRPLCGVTRFIWPNRDLSSKSGAWKGGPRTRHTLPLPHPFEILVPEL